MYWPMCLPAYTLTGRRYIDSTRHKTQSTIKHRKTVEDSYFGVLTRNSRKYPNLLVGLNWRKGQAVTR